MTDRASLIRRLRRLVDDVGHGYSQSAPGWSTHLCTTGLATPTIGILLDDATTLVNVPLSSVATLINGTVIALDIQTKIRSSDPGLLLPTPVRTPAYDGISCVYDPREGYIIRSGTIGNLSSVHVFTSTTGDDATPWLKLGLGQGGYESTAKVDWSDSDLAEIMDLSLAEQNNTGDISSWTYATLPSEYENVIVYRSWSSLVDTMLGRAAWFHPQKVASEEVTPNIIFDNLYKLARWLRDRVEEMVSGFEGQIEVYTTTVWDREAGAYVGDNVYKNSANTPRILKILPGANATQAILEFAEILTPDIKKLYIGMKGSAGVFDQTIFTVENSNTDTDITGLSSGALLVRRLTTSKNTMVKVTGLVSATTYYFAIQTVDQNGNRHFSGEVSFTTD